MRHERLPLRAARQRAQVLSATQFVCIVFLTVALVPAGAHLFELPNKLAMAPHDYLVAQASYRGWALFGIVVAGAVALSGLHAYLVRANRAAFRWSLIALACLAAAQIIFWTFTNPVNVLTDNWTSMPADLESARRQWEFSHAAESTFDFAALVAMLLSVLASRPCAGAGIIAAIGKDIEARMARERALSFADIGVENRGPRVADVGITMAVYRGRSAAPPRGPFANGTGSRSRA